MKRYFLLIVMCALFIHKGQTQSKKPAMCQTDQQMDLLYRTHPASLDESVRFEQTTKQKRQSNYRIQAEEYTIPVVFHVFGSDFAGQSVDDNTIITALEKVNEDFHGLNDDYSTVSPLFSGIKSTLDVEFKLAKLDPSGNPTTGIVYYPERSGFGNGSGYNTEIQQFAWDNYMYMNVYIMLDLYDDNTYNNSGVAWYPDSWMSDNDLARVVYNGRYLYGNTSKEFASVLTHEFGHWLNLAHTFDNGCSAPGDNVADTPATTSNSGTCNTTTEKCPGAGIPNGENYMDYSNCYKMFTEGQIARMVAALGHSARQPLWQESNLIATGVNDNPVPRLLYAKSLLKEDDNNSGGIDSHVIITAENGAQFANTGMLSEGTHFSVNNVPAGLSAEIEVLTLTSAKLSFSGSAALHADADDVSSIAITFLDPAISGGVSAIQSPTYSGFSLDFKDPYRVVYNDISDITANSGATWTYFSLEYGDGEYGCWYDGGKLRLETYQKSLVCEGSTRNISLLAANTPISTGSNWIAGGAYPDQHDLRSSTYTIWDGQTGYIGFQFSDPDGKTLNGWFRVGVNSSGTSFTLYDYAYYTKPGGTILAGATSAGGSSAPDAAFSASSQTVSTGGSVTFTDESGNTPNEWQWTFSGGTPATSTDQHPTVSYGTSGVYDVQLIATNSAGSDTLMLTDYITVESGSVTYCSSSSDRSSYEHIAEVTLNDFSYSSGATNYSDFTDVTIGLDKGANSITLTPGFSGDAYAEYFRVWIDYNGDGDFEDVDELAFDAGSTSTTAVSGTLTVPTSAQEGSTRMRVSMKYNGAPSSCETFADGEVEDYTVQISPATFDPPAAPSALSATSSSSSEISLSWSDNSSDETGFEIERSQGGGYVLVTTLGSDVTSYADGGLMAETTYSYRVRSKNSVGYSAYSNVSNATTMAATTPDYCTASAGNPSGQYIQSVTIGDISNGSSYEPGGYSDYTSQQTSVGSTATLTVTPHTTWAGTRAKGWVDWNRDGDFSDSGEEVYSVTGTGNYSKVITIPGTASGRFTLRVRVAYGQAPTPCGSIHFSETEDYSLDAGGAAGANNSEISSFTVFPNPVKGRELQVKHVAYQGDLEVMIYSLKGMLIHKESLSPKGYNGEVTIKLDRSLEGLFLVHFINQDNSAVSKIYFNH